MKTLSIDKYKLLMKGTAPLPPSYRPSDDLYWPLVVPPPSSTTTPVWPSGTGVRAHLYYFLYLASKLVPIIVLALLLGSILSYWFGTGEPEPGVGTVGIMRPPANNFDAKYILIKVLIGVAALVAAFSSERYFRWWRVGQKTLLKHDPRPPVLVLRSFTPLDVQTDDVDTYGQQLELRLKRYGPVISLRNDSQKLPPRGPYSLEVADSEWQKEVLSYMEQSVAIIIFAGLSEGLWWELNEMATRGFLYRTAFVFPSSFRTYDFKLLREMLSGTSQPTTEDSRRLKDLRNAVSLVEPLADRPEFEVFWQNEIDEALVLRWTLSGEPVVITGSSRTPEAINEALSLSVLISRTQSVPRQ